MIYNFGEYIESIASFPVNVDGWNENSENEAINVTRTTGETQNRNIRTDHTVQIIVRSEDRVKAKQQADSIHSIINNKYGIIAPEVTVNSVVYPEIRLWRINALQDPSFIGADVNGLNEYSANYIITTQES